MKEKDFNEFKTKTLPELTTLLAELQKDIGEEYRASEDDTEPSMFITIATDDELSTWTYQTGDNSYSGACYHFPYWGIGSLYRHSNCAELANEIIENLAEVIDFN